MSHSWLQVGLLLLTSLAVAQSDRACLTVGRAPAPPHIDGRIGQGEWDSAAVAGSFLVAGARSIAQPPTTVCLMFDDRALYLAFQCFEPDAARPRGFRRDHDDRAFEDDCVQVFIAPENVDEAADASINFGGYVGAYNNWYKDIQTYYEFTVNCMGSTAEARNDVRSWDVPWQAHVRRQGDMWCAEMAIPFLSMGVTTPADGTLWGLNLFRMRQPDASGWVFSHFGGYTPLPLGAICLSSGVPLVRQHPPSAPQVGANELRFEVVNPGDQPVQVEGKVLVAGGRPISQGVTVVGQSSAQLKIAYDLGDRGGPRASYEIRAGGRDIPLLVGFVPLPRPSPCRLSLRHYAVPGFVEGTVQLNESADAKRAVLTLWGPRAAPAEASADLAGVQGDRLRLPVSGQPGDEFRSELQVLAADGEPIVKRSIEFTVSPRPPWMGTRAGLPLRVLPPWTPVTLSGQAVDMLGKRITFDDLALPASIRSAEAELLAAPMRLVVQSGTEEIAWRRRRAKIVEQADDHVKFQSTWRSADLRLDLTCNVEYDGFCWIEVELRSRHKTSVDRVALEVPLCKEVARYAYRGHAQAAGSISPLGLRQPITQNLWIGDGSRGLAWLAESLEWVRAGDRGRQVEIVPGPTETVWRSTFIDEPTQLSEPYIARFALHVTPAKPVGLRKSRIFHGAYYGLEDARAAGSVSIPAQGNLELAQGAIECWIKPNFDPEEAYDPAAPRSKYNRQFLTLSAHPSGPASEMLILYYNADDRSMRLVKRDADGKYPVCLAGPMRLPKDQWSYVGVSWGDGMRLNVNGKSTSYAAKGSVSGDISQAGLHVTLRHFAVDELRISRSQRRLAEPPAAPFDRDADTLFLERFDTKGERAKTTAADSPLKATSCALVDGKFGRAMASSPESALDRLAAEGKRIVIFHERWSRYQGYPDLEQAPKLKRIADACHARGMLFLVYFNQSVSTACPEWPALKDDLLVLPQWRHYHRDDVPQDCYGGCVNGPYGDLLLDGIAKLADEAGIDGVYMDGTTVPWNCGNPSHPSCGEYLGAGRYLPHQPIRATRQFMKRLRNIFAQRREEFFLDAHTGGCINVATQSFCDGHWEGETLARYKPGFRLSPDTFLAGYMGKQFGVRGELLPNRHNMDQALAVSLVHDTATRGQPAAVDMAWAPYEGAETRFIPYWEGSRLYRVTPAEVLGSVYLGLDRALIVVGSQTEQATDCSIDIRGLLAQLPRGVTARDATSGAPLRVTGGRVAFPLPGRMWRMVELSKP